VGFLHQESEVLAEVLALTGVRVPVLVGHSDGASIAIIHAASQPALPLRGLVLEAPHVFVEDVSITSITEIAEQYHQSDLPTRLARHHGPNTEIAFWGWNRVWLAPEFRRWNIEACLPSIRVPILILQGEDDRYGTWRQVEAIERQSGGPVQSVRLARCGHAVHRDRPDAVTPAIVAFVRRIGAGGSLT
jgi:pimeloyl-ACP methyl ester carboxylesterase